MELIDKIKRIQLAEIEGLVIDLDKAAINRANIERMRASETQSKVWYNRK